MHITRPAARQALFLRGLNIESPRHNLYFAWCVRAISRRAADRERRKAPRDTAIENEASRDVTLYIPAAPPRRTGPADRCVPLASVSSNHSQISSNFFVDNFGVKSAVVGRDYRRQKPLFEHLPASCDPIAGGRTLFMWLTAIRTTNPQAVESWPLLQTCETCLHRRE